MKIILDEKQYAEEHLKNGIGTDNPYFVISIIAKYYYHECNYRKKRIITLLLDYLKKYYPRYELNMLSWQMSVDKIASGAGSRPLYKFTGVNIYKSEIDRIKALHSKTLERLAFTMLCLAKYSNKKNPKNNGWVNVEPKEVFKYARISCSASEREVKNNKLWQSGLIEFSKRNDNLNCRVTFVVDEGEEELFVSDFRELGYEYMAYCGENLIRCKECGVLTRNNKNKTKKYCDGCSAYTPIETKKIICVDCGSEFETSSLNTKTTRCYCCQRLYRNAYQKQIMKKKRLN